MWQSVGLSEPWSHEHQGLQSTPFSARVQPPVMLLYMTARLDTDSELINFSFVFSVNCCLWSANPNKLFFIRITYCQWILQTMMRHGPLYRVVKHSSSSMFLACRWLVLERGVQTTSTQFYQHGPRVVIMITHLWIAVAVM